MTKCFLVNFFLQIFPEVEMASFDCVYISTHGPVTLVSILYLASHRVFDIEISLAKPSLPEFKPFLVLLADCWVDSLIHSVYFNNTPFLIIASAQRPTA